MKYYLLVQFNYYKEERLISIKSFYNNLKRIKSLLLEGKYIDSQFIIRDMSFLTPKCKKSFRKYYLSDNLEFIYVSKYLIDISFHQQNFKSKLIIYED